MIVCETGSSDDHEEEDDVGAGTSPADAVAGHRRKSSARVDSTRKEGRRRLSSRRTATRNHPADAGTASEPQNNKTGTIVPLKDLRWGLELILACLAPYLANGITTADETGADGCGIPTASDTGGGVRAMGSVANNKRRRRSTSTSAFTSASASTFASTSTSINSPGHSGPATGTGDGSAAKPKTQGREDSSGSGNKRDDNAAVATEAAAAAAEAAEKQGQERQGEEAHRCKLANLGEESGGDCDGNGDAGRCRLALRVVDFACRHPDIGPALVSSILVGWIPLLVRVGCPTPPPPAATTTTGPLERRPHGPSIGATAGANAAASVAIPLFPAIPSLPYQITASGTRCAAYSSAGESAASAALASGAIYMLIFMVKNFPLLPLSDYSEKALAGAAEGGMAFADYTHAAGVSNDGRQGNGIRWERGKWGSKEAAATSMTFSSGRGHFQNRRKARQAGEALMVELFLLSSGKESASDGGGRVGGLNLGLELGLDSLLPALNTARGINFLNETSSAAATAALTTRTRSKKPTRGGEGQGDQGNLAGGRSSQCSWGGKTRSASHSP